ncbi:MAG: N-acetylmuramoyl-L-alanine amidase [Hyphomicrobiales bacterium]|nr:N-acetylmuramoyl-L-alanine amidase [Hyphomicrobiales bacterium]
MGLAEIPGDYRRATRRPLSRLHWLLVLAALAAAVDATAEATDPTSLAALVDELPPGFRTVAKSGGEPRIPGLRIIYLHPLGLPESASRWRNIIVHQTEGPPGSARHLALAQFKNPTKRGVTIWVETDGTVYWSTAETAIPTHGDGANRNDSKYIDNSRTYQAVLRTNSIGVEFIGNYPDVTKPASPEQTRAWLVLVRFLQERYEIPADNVYAHNWIDFKDRRYCEGCELAALARRLNYRPGLAGVR